MPKLNNKQIAERRHRSIHRFLTREFPICDVKYNGIEGHDQSILYEGKTTLVETKTCNAIISAGIDHSAPNDRPMLFVKHRLGRFKFDRRKLYPYTVSQHDDLVEASGWYIFLVGGKRSSIVGMPANELVLSETPYTKTVSWASVLARSSPNWLEKLKIQVYTKAEIKTNVKEGEVKETCQNIK